MNRLFVVNKPIFISSNFYMNRVKRKYNTKKVGFSGTLDPFATGNLIVATGQYTKLFQYLKKTPKTYLATLWLGAKSPSLDIEQLEEIKNILPLDIKKVEKVIDSFKGELSYFPPQFSAKKIKGVQAYKMAREGKEAQLKEITSTIFNIELINYNHPFIHFKATVSEGTYIRSLGELIAKKLGVNGILSSLHRKSEGAFKFENEKKLNPLDYLKIEENRYLKDVKTLELGQKLKKEDFENRENKVYYVNSNSFFSIIEIKEDKVSYRLNKIMKKEEL